MDAHHGFTEAAYVRFLNDYEPKLQAAESRKGQRPEMIPSRDLTITQFMFRYTLPPTNPIHAKFQRTSTLPPAYAPCISAFDTLKRCMFKVLALETHHRGLYMMLRAVTPPRSTMSVTVIAEDKDRGFVQRKLFCIDETNIRHSYSQPLNSSPSTAELIIITQNRALCFLKTRQFDAALSDLDGLSESEPSEKTLYRKARALYHLQRFQEVSLFLKTLELRGLFVTGGQIPRVGPWYSPPGGEMGHDGGQGSPVLEANQSCFLIR